MKNIGWVEILQSAEQLDYVIHISNKQKSTWIEHINSQITSTKYTKKQFTTQSFQQNLKFNQTKLTNYEDQSQLC